MLWRSGRNSGRRTRGTRGCAGPYWSFFSGLPRTRLIRLRISFRFGRGPSYSPKPGCSCCGWKASYSFERLAGFGIIMASCVRCQGPRTPLGGARRDHARAPSCSQHDTSQESGWPEAVAVGQAATKAATPMDSHGRRPTHPATNACSHRLTGRTRTASTIAAPVFLSAGSPGFLNQD